MPTRGRIEDSAEQSDLTAGRQDIFEAIRQEMFPTAIGRIPPSIFLKAVKLAAKEVDEDNLTAVQID